MGLENLDLGIEWKSTTSTTSTMVNIWVTGAYGK